MIVGTGIDIVEVERIAAKLSRTTFKEKIFSKAECAYCESTADRNQHYAARFAAKEAFLKATGKGLTIGYELDQIEVIADDLGKPSIRLSGNFQLLATQNGWNKVHLSLSHVQAMACAVVIIES